MRHPKYQDLMDREMQIREQHHYFLMSRTRLDQPSLKYYTRTTVEPLLTKDSRYETSKLQNIFLYKILLQLTKDASIYKRPKTKI